jgi:hypothetical protein
MQGFIRQGSFRFLIAERAEDVLPLLREAAREIPEAELRGPAARAVAEEM